jgi:hypothetical protein
MLAVVTFRRTSRRALPTDFSDPAFRVESWKY